MSTIVRSWQHCEGSVQWAGEMFSEAMEIVGVAEEVVVGDCSCECECLNLTDAPSVVVVTCI